MTMKRSQDAKDDSAASGDTPAAEREPRRSAPRQPREPLHALIVHFDAQASSELPAADEEGARRSGTV
jgi:hypothetical protein